MLTFGGRYLLSNRYSTPSPVARELVRSISSSRQGTERRELEGNKKLALLDVRK